MSHNEEWVNIPPTKYTSRQTSAIPRWLRWTFDHLEGAQSRKFSSEKLHVTFICCSPEAVCSPSSPPIWGSLSVRPSRVRPLHCEDPASAGALEEREALPGGRLPGHLLVCLFCHGKYVWVHITHVLPAVGVDDGISIYRQLLVRIHGHQNDSWGKMSDAVMGFLLPLTSPSSFETPALPLIKPSVWLWAGHLRPQISVPCRRYLHFQVTEG